MKLIDAVYEVLKDSAAPIGGKEIERVIRERGLYETKGKTLYASIGSALYTDMYKLGAGSRFVKCGKGRFALKESAAANVQPELVRTVRRSAPIPVPDLQPERGLQIRRGKNDARTSCGKGFVYIFRDKRCKKCVKIGKTSGSVQKRLRQLQTGNPWILEYVTLETSRYDDVERFLHNVIKLISKGKQIGTSEFYRFDPEDAKSILMEFQRLLPPDDFRLVENEREVAHASGALRKIGVECPTPRANSCSVSAPVPERKVFRCTSRGTDATGYATVDGFVVMKGSRLSLQTTISFKTCKQEVKMREMFLDDGTIVGDRLTRDVVCPSISSAAKFVMGASANGKKEWK